MASKLSRQCHDNCKRNMEGRGIKVAQYLTELPSRHVLMQQIQKSLEAAKARFENYMDEDNI